jgi:hypothetical protein
MKTWTALSVTFVLISSGLAVTPRFHPRDVVRQVRSARSRPSAVSCEQLPDSNGFLIDTSVALVPAPNEESVPAVAFDGANFLVVWQDDRSGSDSDIYGARVTPQGTVLDPAGFVISPAANDQCTPSVAFDGANFLVVWQDDRSGSDYDICGARVTPQGTMLDPAGFVISQAADDQCTPSVAFEGMNFLVVWQDYRSDFYGDIYGARVTPQSTVLDSGGIVISQVANEQCSPVLAFDGASFLVVWQDYHTDFYGDIYGARVTPQGTVLDSAGIVISQAGNNQYSPALAFDGVNFFVVWEDNRSGSNYDIYGARVTPQGAVLDSAGMVVSRAAHNQRSPAVGFDGADFLVAWRDYRSGSEWDIYGARVTQQGAVLDSAGVALSQAADHQCSPATAFDGVNFLVVWQDHRSGSDWDIYGARVTPQGAVLDSAGFIISQAACDQRIPSVGFDGANFLVVWQDDRSGSDYDIYGARVTPQGTVLDSAGFVISQAACDQRTPSVGFDGADFLVVWEDYRSGSNYDIYGARVTPQGTALDSASIVISQAGNNQYSPALAFDGANFLVVWEDYRSGSSYDIYGARVTPQGAVLDSAGSAILQMAYDQRTPSVSFGGANFLVVWQDDRRSSNCDIYGARVTPQGTVLDPSGIGISYAAGHQECPALNFDGANFLVVWQDDRSGSDSDIYGARVTPQGTVLDPSGIVISHAAGDQEYPALGSDGADFLVVWQDHRSGSDWDIYGAHVTPGGTVFGSGLVNSQQRDQLYPRLCCGNGGQMLLVYQGWTGTVGGKGYSSYRIWGEVNPNPAVAEGKRPTANGSRLTATIVRGALHVPASNVLRGASCVLLDISGRKVLDLHTGANDVRALAPGVYFLSGPKTEDGRPDVALRKIVVTR